MARTTKTPKNEAEIGENVEYLADIAPVNTETAPEKAEKYSIADDPYLTDEQKDVLFRYEFNKMLKNMVSASTDPYSGTLMMFPNGTSVFVPAKGNLDEVWQYYNAHIKGSSVDNFLARLKESYGDKFRWVNVTVLELNG